MRALPLALALALAAVAAAQLAAGVYVAPDVVGDWGVDCVSPNLPGLSSTVNVRYSFGPATNATYVLSVDIYVQGCANQASADLRQVFVGTYALDEPPADLELGLGGGGNSSTALLNLTYTSKTMYIFSTVGRLAVQQQCAAMYASWGTVSVPSGALDAFTVGCPQLGIGNKTTCENEYDIAATFSGGSTVSLGGRTSAGVSAPPLTPCTPVQRPSSFGYVAARIATPTATPTPTGAAARTTAGVGLLAPLLALAAAAVPVLV